jgi:pyruvate dehydrogenase E1 component alpha subunit
MGLLERRILDNIPDYGRAHGVVSERLDGNDVITVYEAACEAVDRARSGDGPTLLECRTFRWRGHVGHRWDMDVGVKRKDELQEWLKKDPIERCEKVLVEAGVQTAELDEIRSLVEAEVADAVDFARQSPYPESSDLTEHVYWAA